MSHSSHASVEPQSRWRRWILAILVAATLIFGFWGNWLYEKHLHPNDSPDLLSVVYHSCQFLILHGVHLHDPVPWQLHIGRFLGVITLFAAGMVAFAKFFKQETLTFRLRLPWRKGHVIICGLGDHGLRMALDARKRRRFVVAIEKDGEIAAVEQARRGGILVVEGDACDAATLRKARIECAEFIVATCPDDATNVAIAAIAGQSLPTTARRSHPLVCRLLLRDLDLRRVLEDQAAFDRMAGLKSTNSVPNYKVNFRDLDVQDTAARQVLRQHPLDFQPIRPNDETTVHLVIVGFGAMGQSLALHAARIGHFANGKDVRMRLTIVAEQANKKIERFRSRHDKISKVCEVSIREVDPSTSALLTELDDLSRERQDRQELLTYALCFETKSTSNDLENLRIGLEVSRLAKDRPVQTLIYQGKRCGFAALFPADSPGPGISRRVHAFGMIEDIYSWDVLLHESEDEVARALHEDYLKHRSDTQHKPWEELDEHFRESNRHAADHIPIKLRALGYHDAPLEPQRQSEPFSTDQVILLAQMEHRRFCAERWLGGWKYGPETITREKVNKDLVDWDELPPEEQEKDFEQIRAIPAVLKGAIRGIYR